MSGNDSAARRLRVAALIDTAQVSGPGRQLAALARCLEPRGVDFLVVMFHREGRPRPPYAQYLERTGVRVAVLPERNRADLRLLARLRDTLAEFGPDIVQTHSYKTTVLAYLLRLRADFQSTVPWLAFFHGATTENLKVRAYNWLDRRLLARADRLVVMSRAHQAGFASLAGRVRVIHNAVLPAPAPAGELSPPAALAETSGRPLLGVVGRLSSEKGVDVFLRAARLLVDRGVRFGAVVAGDGVDRGALERLRDELDLGDVVQFIGTVTDVDALYARLDLLVIPSRSEGLPNVLLEALRQDLPAVATRVGAVPEVLESPLAGIMVPPNSPAALADAIVRGLALKDDPAARVARREAAERFSLGRRADAHIALYHEVLRERELAKR